MSRMACRCGAVISTAQVPSPTEGRLLLRDRDREQRDLADVRKMLSIAECGECRRLWVQTCPSLDDYRGYRPDEPGTGGLLRSAASQGGGDSGGCWTVWRQDDNGNRAQVSTGYSREEAERVCARFEALRHKQVLWVTLDHRSQD